jgi:hypothetical protein
MKNIPGQTPYSPTPISRNDIVLNKLNFSSIIKMVNAKYVVTIFVPSNSNMTTNITVYSANGTRVFTQKMIGTGSHTIDINRNKLAKGINIIGIINGKQSIFKKLIF